MNFLDYDAYMKGLCLTADFPEEPRYIDVLAAPEQFRDVKVCAFTGHRPEKMELYEESDEKCMLLKFKLRMEISRAIKDGYTVFLTGMARGIDTWAAESVLELSLKSNLPIKLYAAIPYSGQAENWLEWEKERYDEILRFCEGVFLVSKKYSKICMKKRNEFLVNNSDLLIAVYGGKSGGTANTIKMAEKSQKNIRFVSV